MRVGTGWWQLEQISSSGLGGEVVGTGVDSWKEVEERVEEMRRWYWIG